jgi:hypothetical protein
MKKGIIITLICIGLIILGYFGFLNGTSAIRAKRAQSMGHKYIQEVYQDYTLVGEHCQGIDTDADGYVSCDFRITKNEQERIVNLQCPTISKSFIGSSCKESRIPVMGQ